MMYNPLLHGICHHPKKPQYCYYMTILKKCQYLIMKIINNNYIENYK